MPPEPASGDCAAALRRMMSPTTTITAMIRSPIISIDAVMGFPDSVLRQPARFGVSAGEARAVVTRLRAELDSLLARLTGSDGEEV